MAVVDKFDVTGLGSLAVDFIGNIEHWPEPGTKNPFTDFDIFDGGLTGTALTAVSRMGGKASFIGKLGKSGMAKRAAKALENEGIDLSNLINDNISEPIIAFVLSGYLNGERNIFFQKKNLNFPYPEEITDKYWYKRTKLFFTDHVAGEAGVLAARIAKKNDLEIVIDIERIQDESIELLELANHIVVSEGFAKLYSGSDSHKDQIKSLRKNNHQDIVITLGEKGCIVKSAEELLKVEGLIVDVIDTTGCGDTFHGIYALEISKGKNPFYAAKIANIAAAQCATERGARTAIPYLTFKEGKNIE